MRSADGEVPSALVANSVGAASYLAPPLGPVAPRE